MIKAIFYKEWLKTRWYYLASTLTILGFTSYCMMSMSRVIKLKGVDHLWSVMLQKDVIFVDILQYIPLILGTLFAVVQFYPEMNKKCVKLTLHLPFSQLKMLLTMLLSGLGLLFISFVGAIALLWLFLNHYLAAEMARHVLLTTTVWYLAGVLSYLLFSWVCLEPSWGRRVLNIVVSVLLLKIFFLSSVPEAYNQFLTTLTLFTILSIILPWISITRFKEGKQ